MYANLKEFYKIRDEKNGAIIIDTRIDKTLNKVIKINDSKLYFFRLLNLNFSIEDIKLMLFESNDKTEVEKGIDDFLVMYADYLIFDQEPIVREDLFLNNALDKIENKEIDKYISPIRLHSPIAISLIITKRCTTKCKYCFTNGGENAEVNEISYNTLSRVIDELYNIGVAVVNLTGGDPFSRKDIFKIIEKLLTKNICFNLSTKKILTLKEILLLKQSGLKKIQYSLDSLDDSITEYLVGVPNFATNMMRTIQCSIENGIDVEVNIVATRYNIERIYELVYALDRVGVKKIFISPYLKSMGRHDEFFFPTAKQYNMLQSRLDKYKGKSEIDYVIPSKDERVKYHDIGSMQYCTGGRESLVVYPSGSVGICERILDQDLLPFNVCNDSILDIWYSEELFDLIQPCRNKITNTICKTCNDFEICTNEKGLCYARAKMATNDYFSGDPLCKKINGKMQFI